MTDPMNITAEALLGIPQNAPEWLFDADETHARDMFRRLRSRWHPDHSDDPRAAQVFERVNALFKSACRKRECGDWEVPGELRLTAGDRAWKVRYLAADETDIGKRYIGHSLMTFVIAETNRDLADNAVARIRGLKFADDGMREQMSPFLPRVERSFNADQGHVVMIAKSAGQVLLRDLWAHLGKRVDPRHVAWMVNGLLNVCCYLEWAKLAHNAIGLDSCLVECEKHGMALAGGWWYAATQGEALHALPAETVFHGPASLLRNKRAEARTDLELVRHVGRQLLGLEGCDAAVVRKNTPQVMLDWLSQPSAGSARRDYEEWGNVLARAFGPRRFVPLDIDPAAVCADRATS